jgi:hypothetical protein
MEFWPISLALAGSESTSGPLLSASVNRRRFFAPIAPAALDAMALLLSAGMVKLARSFFFFFFGFLDYLCEARHFLARANFFYLPRNAKTLAILSVRHHTPQNSSSRDVKPGASAGVKLATHSLATPGGRHASAGGRQAGKSPHLPTYFLPADRPHRHPWPARVRTRKPPRCRAQHAPVPQRTPQAVPSTRPCPQTASMPCPARARTPMPCPARASQRAPHAVPSTRPHPHTTLFSAAPPVSTPGGLFPRPWTTGPPGMTPPPLRCPARQYARGSFPETLDLKSTCYDATATEMLAAFVNRTLTAYPRASPPRRLVAPLSLPPLHPADCFAWVRRFCIHRFLC